MFPTREGLYRYMLSKDVDFDSCVVLELDADPSKDVDFDADQGAMLVIPKRICACASVDTTLAQHIARATAQVG